MFSYFEARLDPYPAEPGRQPPPGFIAFCWHYSKEAAPWLLALSILTALISIGEVVVFGFLGNVVDWLANADRNEFLEREGSTLLWMGATVLVGLPLAVVLHALLVHQTLHQLREQGKQPGEAILLATRHRVRPIFMSTLTSVFGMLPLVLFPGAGSELYRGLGSVVVGGLALSAVLTLVLIPPMMSILLGARRERQTPLVQPST